MKKTILIVEDDAITRYMMTEMCDELGYAFATAANGEQCLEMLLEQATLADLVLMDIHMPKVSGLGACAAIRAAASDPPRSLPIVAVTADEGWHDDRMCREAGFDGVIAKPVSLDEMKKLLGRFFDTP